jgi:hypothetical protein
MGYFNTILGRVLDLLEGYASEEWASESRNRLSGEYWLTDSGVIYADGDAGFDVPNHEMVVVAYAMGEVVDVLEQSEKFYEVAHIMSSHMEEGVVDVIGARTDLLNWADMANKEGILTNDEVDDIEATIIKQAGIDPKLLSVAFGSVDDAREYGLFNLGWARVAGNSVQVVGLTRSKLIALARGLAEAFDDEISDRTTFDIEEYKSHKTYWKVPFYVLEDGDPTKLREYS